MKGWKLIFISIGKYLIYKIILFYFFDVKCFKKLKTIRLNYFQVYYSGSRPLYKYVPSKLYLKIEVSQKNTYFRLTNEKNFDKRWKKFKLKKKKKLSKKKEKLKTIVLK